MTQFVNTPRTTCDCAALEALDPLLRAHRAATSQLVALTDEGMLCVVDTWPHECTARACWGHAWSDAEWSIFLEHFTAEGPGHYVTADGRAVIPILQQQLLWGAIVVDPGEAPAEAVAAALAPHTSELADSVRQHTQ